MEIVYSGEEISSSVFLAGPTPRRKEVVSWRPEAIKIFERLNFNGVIYYPEDRFGNDFEFNKNNQIEWEQRCLNISSVILFWIPRDIKSMPGFTTNLEFGRYMDSGKIVLGVPDSASKMSWIKYHTKKIGIPIYDSLEKTVIGAIEKTKKRT